MYTEKHYRSIIKTITWRIIATLTTAGLVLIFTGRLDAAIIVGGLEAFLKMIFYYLHERSWDKLKLGKTEVSPFLLWFTGLPEAGKSKLAEVMHEELKKHGRKVEWLDSDNVRELFPSLGFSKEERNLHIRRIGHLASTLTKNNIVVIASFISPYEESRQFVRKITHNFIEVYVNTPLEVCEKRDSKGLYAKARKGEITQFTGIDDPYEAPKNPELIINTAEKTLEEAVKLIMAYLKKKKLV